MYRNSVWPIILSLFFFSIRAQESPAVKQLLEKASQLAKTNYDSALVICSKAVKEAGNLKDDYGLAEAWKLSGYCEYFKSNYPAALQYYQKAEKLATEKKYNKILISLHNLQGTFYKKQKRLKEALAEFEKGERMAREENDQQGIASFKNDIGLVYELEQKFEDAARNYKEALLLYKNIGDKGGMSYSLDYLGEAYANMGNFKEALSFMLQCLELRKESGQQAPLAINLNNVGEIYVMQNKYSDALPYLLQSEKISAEIKYSDLRNHTQQLIARCYYAGGNFKSAYDYFEKAAIIKDSIYSEKNAHIINEMEAKYQNEKKQMQIEGLNRENELKEARLSKQKIVIALVLVVALLSVGGVIFVIRSNRKIKKAHHIISVQKHLVEEKQKEILDSIYYARRIQRSLMTSEKYIKKHIDKLKQG